jgi:hypothetical protein
VVWRDDDSFRLPLLLGSRGRDFFWDQPFTEHPPERCRSESRLLQAALAAEGIYVTFALDQRLKHMAERQDPLTRR